MYKENGFAYQVLALIIIIIIAIAGVLINKVVGRNGVINRVAEVETEFNKEDILEKINYKVTQKFIELNNEAKASGRSISEIYNSDVVIEFLKQSFIIEQTYDEEGNVQEGVFLIDVEKLKEDDDGTNYQGTFKLEKIQEKYMVVYYNENGKSKEVGELKIQQT